MKSTIFSSATSSRRHVRRLAGYLALGLAAILPLSAHAQDGGEGTIEGRVLNGQTGRYLSRALVTVENSSQRTFTNQFGEYELYGLPVGTVTVRVFFTGMSSQTATVEVLPDQTVEQDFTLLDRESTVAREEQDEEAFELADYVVMSSDSFQTASEIAIQEERFSVNLKNVVDTDAYGITAQGNVGEFVKFIPGVTVGYGGTAGGGTYASGADVNTISIRGYSANETSVTIDGMSIANAAPGTLDPAVGLDMMSINNASRVEVIKVPSPDQPSAGIGGTVNLVSKTAFEYPKPTLNFRAYLSMNSENMDVFSKTPGPMNKRTYKTLPSFDMTYAHPINDKIGFSLTLSSSNQANEGHTLKSKISRLPEQTRPELVAANATVRVGGKDYNRWIQNDPNFGSWQQQYGEDWSQWTDAEKRQMYAATGLNDEQVDDALFQIRHLPRFNNQGDLLGSWSPEDREAFEEERPVYVDANGNPVGRVFADWNHPYINRVQVTDSPRISNRESGALKVDWRPLDGMIVTANYQLSKFRDQDAKRRVEQDVGTPYEYGPNYVYSNDGGVHLNTDAFTREGTTHSGYVRASYIKGPWNISGHISHSTSESDILTAEEGHFSVVELNMGDVDYTEFLNISGVGVPQEINHYRDIEDEDGNFLRRERIDIADLSNYGIANYDPDDPTAATLKVNSAGIHAESEVSTAKFDMRRDLDFIPGDFMNLAIKFGGDWEERSESKSGRGTNYQYLYVGGEEGGPLDIDDFRDTSYVDVEPGYGLAPLQWPDIYKLYEYHINNPGAFSDTNDDVPTGSGEQRSVAANNYLQEVNTSKAITETKTAYYAQLEGDFFKNRLSIVGGFRYTERERKGNNPTENSRWNRLALNQDVNGDGLPDVFPETPWDIDPAFGMTKLPEFNVTDRRFYNALGALGEAKRQQFLSYYEAAGAVYADGTPFIASEFELIEDGSLKSYQLRHVKDYEIREKSRGQPQPIISAAYDITDRLVGRVSWSTTYSNPPFENPDNGAGGTLRKITFNENDDGSGSLAVTNPNLKISKSVNWDVGLSYYTDSGGKFSINGYWHTEYDRPIKVTYSPGTSGWEEFMDELGYGPGSYQYLNRWTASSDINAEGTFVNYGYELEARQELGVLGDWGKYIFVYGSFFQQFQKSGDIPEGEEGEFDISNDNETRLNASGGISITYKRFSLRANATWENERTVRITDNAIFWRDPLTGNPGWYTPSRDDDDIPEENYRTVREVSPSDLRIDMNASFRLTDHYTLDFSARNITNSNPENIYILEGEGSLPHAGQIVDGTEKNTYGINFTVGISGHF